MGLMFGGSAALTALQYVEYGLSDVRGAVTTPLAALMPSALGIAVGMTTGPGAPRTELLGGARLARASRVLVVVMGVLACALVGAALTVAAAQRGGPVPMELTAVLCRATLAWSGLAVLAAALLGPHRCWVLPGLSIALVTLFGYDEMGVARPWNVVSAPSDSLGAVGVTATLVLLGAVAWEMSRYRGPRWLVMRAITLIG